MWILVLDNSNKTLILIICNSENRHHNTLLRKTDSQLPYQRWSYDTASKLVLELLVVEPLLLQFEVAVQLALSVAGL